MHEKQLKKGGKGKMEIKIGKRKERFFNFEFSVSSSKFFTERSLTVEIKKFP